MKASEIRNLGGFVLTLKKLFVILSILTSTLLIVGNAYAEPENAGQEKSSSIIIIDGGEACVVPSYRGTVVENKERLRRRAEMSSRGGLIANNAKRYIGVPYVWGGTSSNGFDCSGFVKSVYANNGINITRMADEQYYNGNKIGRADLQVGDLVFFETYTSGISHVGIYIGDNKFIHASSSRGVTIDSLSDPYFNCRYRGACRY